MEAALLKVGHRLEDQKLNQSVQSYCPREPRQNDPAIRLDLAGRIPGIPNPGKN